MKAKRLGELMQIDHMNIGFTKGVTLKAFKANCPATGTTIMQCSSSRNARRFLEYLIAALPYDLLSIQVDGGNEFRGEFEAACRALGIPLFVLPPRKPKWNSCVERVCVKGIRGTTLYEFYPFYETLNVINQKLAEYQHVCNHYRSHDGIGLKTPISSSITHTGGLIGLIRY